MPRGSPEWRRHICRLFDLSEVAWLGAGAGECFCLWFHLSELPEKVIKGHSFKWDVWDYWAFGTQSAEPSGVRHVTQVMTAFLGLCERSQRCVWFMLGFAARRGALCPTLSWHDWISASPTSPPSDAAVPRVQGSGCRVQGSEAVWLCWISLTCVP